MTIERRKANDDTRFDNTWISFLCKVIFPLAECGNLNFTVSVWALNEMKLKFFQEASTNSPV